LHSQAKNFAMSSEDRMRADLYGLLAKLLFYPPNSELVDQVSKLSGDETEMGEAFNTLAKLAGKFTLKEIQDEFDGLFIGMGRGELLPYGSYYLTGFLNEKPLAKLRHSMRKNQ